MVLLRCARCNEEKDSELFRVKTRSKTGKNSYCKSCQDKAVSRAYFLKREKRLAEIKNWQRMNRKRIGENVEDWKERIKRESFIAEEKAKNTDPNYTKGMEVVAERILDKPLEFL